ncbi:MAG: glycosyltransferase family 39 protein [Vicinamibacterales bacterium]
MSRPSLVLLAGLALLVIGTTVARTSGLNPESLWYDDLAWAVFARTHDVRAVLHAPSHAPSGFLALLTASSLLIDDPELSMQLVPFAAGLASIPVIAAVVRRLTKSDGLALLGAAVTALNPLLAHYTLFVKQYSLDFFIGALLLYFTLRLLERCEIRLAHAGALIAASALGFAVSPGSSFVSVPAINAVAIRSWRTRRNGVPLVTIVTAVFEGVLAAVAFWYRMRYGGFYSSIREGFIRRLGHPIRLLTFSVTGFRDIAARSLPSWFETTPWQPHFIPAATVFIAAGLVWVLATRSTRHARALLVCCVGLFLVATYTHLYPLTLRRTICSFPVFITLAVMGVHAATQWLPRRETIRMAIGVIAAVFALVAPVQVSYWDVDDSKLVKALPATIQAADGLVLSPAGIYLTAIYGPWRIAFRRGGSGVNIFRERTLQLPDGSADAVRLRVEHFLASSRPPGVAYMGFRTRPRVTETVLSVFEEFGYEPTAAETTSRGTLYIARQVHPTDN